MTTSSRMMMCFPMVLAQALLSPRRASPVLRLWCGINGQALTALNSKQVLLKSADDIGAPGVDEVFGYGRLNIMGALSPIDGLTQ